MFPHGPVVLGRRRIGACVPLGKEDEVPEQLSLLQSFNIAQTRHTATAMDMQLISTPASLPMRWPWYLQVT